MVKYICKRLLTMIPVLFVVSVLVFMMVHMLPGDPARMIAGEMATEDDIALVRASYGLDKPLPEQYITYIKKIFHGDFGTSFKTKRPVAEELAIRFPNTLKLSCAAILFAVVVGVGVGILSATKRYSIFDNFSMLLAMVGLSLPTFYLGLMLILIFCVKLRWMPITGGTGLIATILPAIGLGAQCMSAFARITRSSMLEAMGAEHIMTAKAQGFSRRKVIFGHALKNAMTTITTSVGLQFGALMGGAVVVETVFNWPGLGEYMVTAITARDFPVVQSSILVVACTYVVVNLAVDILYAFVNPKIKFQ